MSAILESRPPAGAAAAGVPQELWYTRCPVPTASGIAQNRGWLQGAFARQGIALRSIRAAPDRAVRESHFRHSLAGSFREGGNVPPIWTRARGQDTVVVAITWVDEQQLVLVRPGSGIHGVADLRGRRLGLARKAGAALVDVPRAEALRGLLTALRIHGVGRDEVRWVDIPEAEWELTEDGGPRRHAGTEALLAGAVDAIFVKGAAAPVAVDRGLLPVFDLNQESDPLLRVSAGSPRPVTVDRATLRAHPALVAHYLAVLLATARWAAGHADEVVATIAAETGASADAVRRAFGPRLHEAFEPRLSPPYRRALADQKEFLRAEGFIDQDFDLDAWLDPRPLEQARALAEGLVLAA